MPEFELEYINALKDMANSLGKHAEHLEKALDKACEQLNCYRPWIDNEEWTPERWKEWCMKDE